MISAGAISIAEINQESQSDLMAAARHKLSTNGYVYLCDVPAWFNHIDFVARFGQFMPQYDGSLVWDLKPEPDMDDVYHSSNTRALVPHTEAYEYPGSPPRYIALWCIEQAEGPGGETTLADGYAWLEKFNQHERRIMFEQEYEWRSSEGLARKGIEFSARHQILERDSTGRIILRYSYNNIVTVGDPFLRDIIERGAEFFAAEFEAVRIERNGLLLWDNWRMLHSRTAFKDRGRHLKRVMVR